MSSQPPRRMQETHGPQAPGATYRHGAAGFSLVEVLVALIVISVGLLGVAKLEALAYSSTGTASVRSLAAIEASSLASAMRANRAYWSVASTATTSITVSGTTVTSADPAFAGLVTGGPSCLINGPGASPCSGSPVDVAAYDVKQWTTALKNVLPNDGASIVCASATSPINCTITVTWNEKTVAINTQGENTAAATSLTGTQSYTLYVEP
jgi:type IV pilus assembly protein PilV